MCKKLNRYARRKRDKYLDFVKGCHRKNFRLERYIRTYNAFPIVTKSEKDTLHESKVRIQNKEWKKSNSHDKLDLMARGRHKVRTYLNNIQREYNGGYEELTDIKLSGKTEMFDKWDWKY